MVPGYSSGLKQGEKMPNDGTARDGRCVVCGERYSSRYYLNSRGPFCGMHFHEAVSDTSHVPNTQGE